jgi:hypothetical protein
MFNFYKKSKTDQKKSQPNQQEFDCWMGHTNFDITPKIKEQLNKIQGVEVLKICSRYRFFIGVGKMFSFTDVRKNIEKDILPK